MAKADFKDLKLYYSNSMMSLKEGDYEDAIKGFLYLINHGIEPQKSVLGILTAYSCLTRYTIALKTYEKNKEYFTDNPLNTGMFIEIMTSLLMKETSYLKKNARGYFTAILMANRMKTVHEAYLSDKDNILAIILICYWYAVLGRRPHDTEQMMKDFLHNEFIDDEFRWKLLEKLSITDKDLMDDITIASLFKRIPRYLDHSYINLLLFSNLSGNNLVSAREKIEVQRMNGVELSDDVMWNYIDLCVENNDIDDLAVNFAKRLFAKGWMDPAIGRVFRYAKNNLNIYNVTNETKALDLFGI
jgi:tetratricopeptide (TPR) repeat protein